MGERDDMSALGKMEENREREKQTERQRNGMTHKDGKKESETVTL